MNRKVEPTLKITQKIDVKYKIKPQTKKQVGLPKTPFQKYFEELCKKGDIYG